MASLITIRDASEGDRDFLVHSNAAMAQETEAKVLDRAILARGVAALLAAPQRGFYLIAERAGERVGCLLVTHEWSDWRNGVWWWLQSVYVRPECRGRGVFAAMYRRIRAEARSTPGVCGLRLYVERENHPAQQVYAKLGMRDEPYRMLSDSLGS
ncbi:MAG: GNAT family N-acetyltransferase [Dokdonella sp.]|nr:GNAT family N-acetyltransferase [Dokdonella sp.]